MIGPDIKFAYADGTTKSVGQRALLSPIPVGHHSTVMWNILSPLPEETPSRRAPGGKFEPPTSLFPGYNLAHVSRSRPDYQESLRAWLRRRSSEFYAGAPVAALSVSWHAESYPGELDAAHPLAGVTKKLMGTFFMDFDAATANKIDRWLLEEYQTESGEPRPISHPLRLVCAGGGLPLSLWIRDVPSAFLYRWALPRCSKDIRRTGSWWC